MSWKNILKGTGATKKLHYPSIKVAFHKVIADRAPTKFILNNFINYFLPIYVETAIELGHYSKRMSAKLLDPDRFQNAIAKLLKKSGFKRQLGATHLLSGGTVFDDSFEGEITLRPGKTFSIWKRDGGN